MLEQYFPYSTETHVKQFADAANSYVKVLVDMGLIEADEVPLIRSRLPVTASMVTKWELSVGQFPLVKRYWSDGTTTLSGRKFHGSRRRLRVWARLHQHDVSANIYIKPIQAAEYVTVDFQLKGCVNPQHGSVKTLAGC